MDFLYLLFSRLDQIDDLHFLLSIFNKTKDKKLKKHSLQERKL